MLHQRGELLGSLHGSGNPSGDILMVVRFGVQIHPQIFYRVRHGDAEIIHLCGQILWIVAYALSGVQRQMFTLIKVEDQAPSGAFFLNEMQKNLRLTKGIR